MKKLLFIFLCLLMPIKASALDYNWASDATTTKAITSASGGTGITSQGNNGVETNVYDEDEDTSFSRYTNSSPPPFPPIAVAIAGVTGLFEFAQPITLTELKVVLQCTGSGGSTVHQHSTIEYYDGSWHDLERDYEIGTSKVTRDFIETHINVTKVRATSYSYQGASGGGDTAVVAYLFEVYAYGAKGGSYAFIMD